MVCNPTPLITIPELSIELYAAGVPAVARTSRRNAERAATADLVERIFGHGAEIHHTTSGAPVLHLPGTLPASPAISISHSENTVILAVSNSGIPVGVDIEMQRTNLNRVAPRFLRPDELDAHGSSIIALLRAWTAKEAAFKAAGIPGITLADISLDSDCSSASFPGRDAPQLAIRHYPGPYSSLIAVASPENCR